MIRTLLASFSFNEYDKVIKFKEDLLLNLNIKTFTVLKDNKYEIYVDPSNNLFYNNDMSLIEDALERCGYKYYHYC